MKPAPSAEALLEKLAKLPTAERLALVPEAKTDPTLIKVETPFCQSCKLLNAKLKNLGKKFPNVKVLAINLEDQKKLSGRDKALLRTFHITTAPTLVGVKMGGDVAFVITEEPTDASLEGALRSLVSP